VRLGLLNNQCPLFLEVLGYECRGSTSYRNVGSHLSVDAVYHPR
jgi:hypothetical protein